MGSIFGRATSRGATSAARRVVTAKTEKARQKALATQRFYEARGGVVDESKIFKTAQATAMAEGKPVTVSEPRVKVIKKQKADKDIDSGMVYKGYEKIKRQSIDTRLQAKYAKRDAERIKRTTGFGGMMRSVGIFDVSAAETAPSYIKEGSFIQGKGIVGKGGEIIPRSDPRYEQYLSKESVGAFEAKKIRVEKLDPKFSQEVTEAVKYPQTKRRGTAEEYILGLRKSTLAQEEKEVTRIQSEKARAELEGITKPMWTIGTKELTYSEVLTAVGRQTDIALADIEGFGRTLKASEKDKLDYPVRALAGFGIAGAATLITGGVATPAALLWAGSLTSAGLVGGKLAKEAIKSGTGYEQQYEYDVKYIGKGLKPVGFSAPAEIADIGLSVGVPLVGMRAVGSLASRYAKIKANIDADVQVLSIGKEGKITGRTQYTGQYTVKNPLGIRSQGLVDASDEFVTTKVRSVKYTFAGKKGIYSIKETVKLPTDFVTKTVSIGKSTLTDIKFQRDLYGYGLKKKPVLGFPKETGYARKDVSLRIAKPLTKTEKMFGKFADIDMKEGIKFTSVNPNLMRDASLYLQKGIGADVSKGMLYPKVGKMTYTGITSGRFEKIATISPLDGKGISVDKYLGFRKSEYIVDVTKKVGVKGKTVITVPKTAYKSMDVAKPYGGYYLKTLDLTQVQLQKVGAATDFAKMTQLQKGLTTNIVATKEITKRVGLSTGLGAGVTAPMRYSFAVQKMQAPSLVIPKSRLTTQLKGFGFPTKGFGVQPQESFGTFGQPPSYSRISKQQLQSIGSVSPLLLRKPKLGEDLIGADLTIPATARKVTQESMKKSSFATLTRGLSKQLQSSVLDKTPKLDVKSYTLPKLAVTPKVSARQLIIPRTAAKTVPRLGQLTTSHFGFSPFYPPPTIPAGGLPPFGYVGGFGKRAKKRPLYGFYGVKEHPFVDWAIVGGKKEAKADADLMRSVTGV